MARIIRERIVTPGKDGRPGFVESATPPTNTDVIAARMNVNLKYDTTPNWETYELFLRMSNSLLARLAPAGSG